MEASQPDKRVDELEPGDVVLNMFDVERVVEGTNPTEYMRPSKWVDGDVPVIEVRFTNGDSPWWNADRKVRVRQ